VVALLVIVSTGVGLFLSASTHSTTLTSITESSGSGVGPFAITHDDLYVGFQGGLWDFGFQNTGSVQVKQVTVFLFTPTTTLMCSGLFGGLEYANCNGISDSPSVATIDPNYQNGFPLNYTFTGYTTGSGAGSAVAGANYTIAITALFVDGSSYNETSTVQALNG
jgi:hypothetical protein